MGQTSGNPNLPQVRHPDGQWVVELFLRLQQSAQEVFVWAQTMCRKL